MLQWILQRALYRGTGTLWLVHWTQDFTLTVPQYSSVQVGTGELNAGG